MCIYRKLLARQIDMHPPIHASIYCIIEPSISQVSYSFFLVIARLTTGYRLYMFTITLY